MTWRRRASILAAALAGTVVGASVAFVAADLGAARTGKRHATTVSATDTATDSDRPNDDHVHRHQPRAASTAPARPVPPIQVEPPQLEGSILLVWTSGGLPAGLSEAAAMHPLVSAYTVVRGDQLDLVRSTTAAGTEVDVPLPGWAIPLDVIAIEPTSFVPFVAPDDARVVGELQPGTALLTRASANLRGLGPGATIELRSGTVTVAGVVDDTSGGGAELLVHLGDAERLGADTERYLLVNHGPGSREAVARELADAAAPAPVRFRSPTETRWLRHGDAVTPPVFVKLAFGEFAYRDRSGRDVEIDPAWVAEHIVSADVPILGSVRCHRAMVEPLRTVLAGLVDTNLAYLVDPSGYAGCWNPRRIGAGQPLSRHAWGVALDLNIGDNPRGSFSTQDPRLVDRMRSAGFVWGGSWLVPDPGHYELDPP